jgi:dipeptidyl aminopeptidase/acylaminoacyl peptidase
MLSGGPDDTDPDWSPDGRTLLISRSCRIAVLNPKTSAVRFLTERVRSQISSCARSPAWSPDGKQIAYSIGDSVYAMRRDGSAKRKIS